MVTKNWQLLFSKRAQNEAAYLQQSKLKAKAELLLMLLEVDPLQIPPPVKKLTGDFTGYYSRRINIRHRLVYAVNETSRTVRVISMWRHYGD